MPADLPDVNPDRRLRVVVDTTVQPWEPSPSGTVWRKPLYRSGGEFGPVTSLVRYAAGGAFAAHAHPEGEEILVLSGVFADDHGEYPAGTHLLNPDGSRHAPRSVDGCELFVRLRQYAGRERRVQRADGPATPAAGVAEQLLYAAAGEPRIALEAWAAGAGGNPRRWPGGGEIFVLAGTLHDELGRYGAGCWLRLPPGSVHVPFAPAGCRLYVRAGA